jgi:hypothetical protein
LASGWRGGGTRFMSSAMGLEVVMALHLWTILPRQSDSSLLVQLCR